MRLFIGRREAEEREIDRNAPPKRGLALLVDVVLREWWELMKLNLLMVLFCLPVVTLPAALAGTVRITMTMVRDENHYLWRDFWQTFRTEFLRATLLGWAAIALIAIGLGSAVAYGRAMSGGVWFAIPAVVSVFGAVYVTLAASHILTLMVATDLRTVPLLRNACLLAAVWFGPGLAAILVCGALWLLHVVAYPVSVFIPATFGFSLSALVMTFQSQRALVRFVVPSPADDPRKGTFHCEQDAQGRPD